tara:strand:+ start:248 stop:838 length:591 start_codon:yes stop_codon:yes gene_type:complete
MKVFITVLVLIFSLQSLTKADDIKEFEIEGMSIGDSLLDYMSEEEINNAEQNATKMKEEFLIIWYNSPSLYDDVSITYRVKDKKYIIHSIMAMLYFDKNIKACEKQKKEIVDEVKNLFTDADFNYREKVIDQRDKSGKTTFSSFDINLKSGAWATVGCTDWSTKMENESSMKSIDGLDVTVNSVEYSKFLDNYYYN